MLYITSGSLYVTNKNYYYATIIIINTKSVRGRARIWTHVCYYSITPQGSDILWKCNVTGIASYLFLINIGKNNNQRLEYSSLGKEGLHYWPRPEFLEVYKAT